MPISLHVNDITLSDIWCDKELYEQLFANNLGALVELLEEDVMALIEDAGGVSGLIQSSEWVDEG